MSLISELTATVGSFQQVSAAQGGVVPLSVLFVPEGLDTQSVITSEIAVGSYLDAAMAQANLKLLNVLKSKYGQNLMNNVVKMLNKDHYAALMKTSTAGMSSEDQTAFLNQVYINYDAGDTWAITNAMTTMISEAVIRQSQNIQVGMVANTTNLAFFGSRGVSKPLSVPSTTEGIVQALKQLGIVYDEANLAKAPPASLTESAKYVADVYFNTFMEAVRNIEYQIGINADADVILKILFGMFGGYDAVAYQSSSVRLQPVGLKRGVAIFDPRYEGTNYLRSVSTSAAVSTDLALGLTRYEYAEDTLVNLDKTLTENIDSEVGVYSAAILNVGRRKRGRNYYVSFFDQYGMSLFDSEDLADYLNGDIQLWEKAKLAKLKVAEETVDKTDEVVEEDKITQIVRYLGLLGLLATDDAWDTWAAQEYTSAANFRVVA